MISLDASQLQSLVVWTTMLEVSLSIHSFNRTGRGKTITLYGVQFENSAKLYNDHIAELYRIGLKSSARGLERVRDYLAQGSPRTGLQLEELLRDFRVRLFDDLSQPSFLALAADDMHLYDPVDAPFGLNVDRVFPTAVDDIREAGACLALGRSTAAVFHLMRVMEAGFKGIAAELGVPYAPSWESYERKLVKILDSANYPQLTDAQKAKRPFYDEILGDLKAIKMVWRNPTMHIVKSYDVNQARSIYASVGSFMRHLAEKLEPVSPFVVSTGPTPQ